MRRSPTLLSALSLLQKFPLRKLNMQVQAKFEQLQKEYINIQQARAKQIDMKYENELVLKNIDTFPKDTKLYHIDGPLLVPQTTEDVKIKVDDKIKFITKQLAQLDKQMKDKEQEIIACNKQRLEAQKQL